MRPPIYHFSAPITSWNPSDELSDPLRLRADAPGMGNAFAVGEVDRWYGAWCCLVGVNWPDAWTAAVVAPGEGGPAFVVMVRDAEGVVEWAVCEAVEVLCGYEVAAAEGAPAAFCTWDWARKAARKPEKKGLFDDIWRVVEAGGRVYRLVM